MKAATIKSLSDAETALTAAVQTQAADLAAAAVHIGAGAVMSAVSTAVGPAASSIIGKAEPPTLFPASRHRPLPYIYAPEEVARIVAAAGRLRRTYPLRREVYATLLGLIAASGLRVSEALDLRFDDLQPNGALLIRRTKFGKSRLIPLHSTVADALDRYLDRRRRLAVTDDHVFLSAGNRRIASSMVNYTFRRVVLLAGVARERKPPCRIHDLRHTFATRSLEQCAARRESVSRHFVSLATYMGHTDIVHTYWYLEATPELMADIATAAEALVAKGGV